MKTRDLELAKPRWTVLAMESLLLLPVLVLALVYRLGGQADPFWLDELHTSWVIVDGPSEIPWRAAAGNQHPLYFYLVWMITQVLGHSEGSIRLLSLLGGVGCVAGVYWLVRSLTSPTGNQEISYVGSIAAALCASLLLAMEPLHIRYSMEGRVYAFVSLVAVLQLLAFIKCWQKFTAGRAFWVAVLAILLFYLHYSTGVIILCEGLLWLLGGLIFLVAPNSKTKEKDATATSKTQWIIGWGITWLAIVVANSLAIGQIREVHARRGNWALFIPDPSFWQTVELGKWWPYLVISFLAAALLLILYVCFAHRLRRDSSTTVQHVSEVRDNAVRYRHVALVPAMAIAVPLAMTLLTWLNVAPAYHARYLLAAAVFSVAAAGCAAVCLPSSRWQLVTAVLIFLAIGLDSRSFENLIKGRWTRPDREGWRDAVAELNANANKSEPILVWAGLIEAASLPEATAKGELAEFNTLPLRGIYQPKQQPLWALPLATKESDLAQFCETYREAPPRVCWLIIRSQRPDRIERILRRNQTNLECLGNYEVGLQVQYDRSVTLVQFVLTK